jgi:hypothetical protein
VVVVVGPTACDGVRLGGGSSSPKTGAGQGPFYHYRVLELFKFQPPSSNLQTIGVARPRRANDRFTALSFSSHGPSHGKLEAQRRCEEVRRGLCSIHQ